MEGRGVGLVKTIVFGIDLRARSERTVIGLSQCADMPDVLMDAGTIIWSRILCARGERTVIGLVNVPMC